MIANTKLMKNHVLKKCFAKYTWFVKNCPSKCAFLFFMLHFQRSKSGLYIDRFYCIWLTKWKPIIERMIINNYSFQANTCHSHNTLTFRIHRHLTRRYMIKDLNEQCNTIKDLYEQLHKGKFITVDIINILWRNMI